MTDNASELRSVAWSQAFPFTRLFRTARMALGVNRLLLALAGIVLAYLGGRILDRLWIGASSGVLVQGGEGVVENELQIYTQLPRSEFDVWRNAARGAHEVSAIAALLHSGKAKTPEEARQTLADRKLRDVLVDKEFRNELKSLRQDVDARLAAGLETIAKDTSLSADERKERRAALVTAADTVQRMLAEKGRGVPATSGAKAIEAIAATDTQDKGKLQAELVKATARLAALREAEDLAPRGPFITLLRHENHCLTMAVRGAFSGRWGLGGGAYDAQPSLCGSLESAARGVCWLFNQKPCLGVFLALWNLLVFSLFGGAVCRSAAVQSARDESISAGEALRFVRERYSGFVLGPLLPVGVVVLIGIFMFLGGLFGAIGYVGELVTGVFYPLALMGGFGAALIVLVTIVAFHLMWPTIAVEGSDGFDALSRACSYVGSRIWHVGFYWFVLLLYGAASFVLVRAVAMVTLKLAHKLTGVGMNLISSAELSGTGKLDAMWSMPAWSDLSFVPGRNTMPLWGSFFNGPLDGTEWLGAWLIALWVFLFIGLLGAFVLNFFFCGSTQVYFLLRRDVDATDWDEIYYEEPEEPAPVPTGESGPAPQVPTAPAEPPPPADSADPPPQS